jgi:hypothetical protein
MQEMLRKAILTATLAGLLTTTAAQAQNAVSYTHLTLPTTPYV